MTMDRLRKSAAIVTLTLNPALDVSSRVASVTPDEKLRCSEPAYEPGGGGINVARAIHQLGGTAVALWTRGGGVGHFLEELLNEERVENYPVPIKGTTRENFVVTDESNERQYRFCHPGPALTESEQLKSLSKLQRRNRLQHIW